MGDYAVQAERGNILGKMRSHATRQETLGHKSSQLTEPLWTDLGVK